MIFIRIIEFISIIVILIFGISQILIPLVRGRKMFPMFRKAITEKQEEIAFVMTEADEIALDKIILESKEENVRAKKDMAVPPEDHRRSNHPTSRHRRRTTSDGKSGRKRDHGGSKSH